MLKKVLSSEDCAACRNCCVFQEESRWETPVLTREKAEAVKKALNRQDCVLPYENSFVLASVEREGELPPGAEPYKCVALNEEQGCVLTEREKPFDCSLWPVRVMRKEDRVYIMLAEGCHTVDGTFIEKINKLLQEGLKEQILKEIKINPDIVKPYTDNYIKLCDITGEL